MSHLTFLHLTNGTAIIPLMREAGISGTIVPWDDVLHEGPVPAGLNVAALRDIRAEFLASCGWGSRDHIARSLAERDAALADPGHVDEIVLWFEHDLFDQLQLIQILDRLPIGVGPRVTAVPGDDYLGHQPASRFGELFGSRREVSSTQHLAARDAWHAFRSFDPRAIVDALDRVTALPHLRAALLRHLQQFPAMGHGLSRTEQLTLTALTRGASTLGEAFRVTNAREGAMFMGDAAFFAHILAVTQGPLPLIARADPHERLRFDGKVAITDTGRRVLDGGADRVALCGINRWLGGVHLQGHGPTWRWHESRRTVVHA